MVARVPQIPVVVDLEDIRLLLQRVEPLMRQLTAHDASDPVIGAIDRLGDAVCVVTQRLFLEKEKREKQAEHVAQKRANYITIYGRGPAAVQAAIDCPKCVEMLGGGLFLCSEHEGKR